MNSLLMIGTVSLANRTILAPMAGVTDTVFRTLSRRHDCALCFTEMVSARGVTEGTRSTMRYLDRLPDDRPLGVQLFGTDPQLLADAAAVAVERGADMIDVNMGCPVKKVVKTGAGAALMKTPELVNAIVRCVRKAIAVPLSVKIRSGWRQGEINAVQIARIAEECGADAVIVHPRTAEQGFAGTADWDVIHAVKGGVTIPVIGSGDIRQPADTERMRAHTGCDGVMIGRGTLGRPWIFRQVIDPTFREEGRDFTLSDREEVITCHLNMNMQWYGETRGVVMFRKHLLWYTKGMKGGCRFREEVTTETNVYLLVEKVRRFFEAQKR